MPKLKKTKTALDKKQLWVLAGVFGAAGIFLVILSFSAVKKIDPLGLWPKTLEGKFLVTHRDTISKKKKTRAAFEYFVVNGKTKTPIKFTGAPPGLAGGEKVRIRCRFLGKTCLSPGGEGLGILVLQKSAPAPAEALGDHKLAVIIYHPSNRPMEYTLDEAKDTLYRSNTSVKKFYQEVSYGKFIFVGKAGSDPDIYGPYEAADSQTAKQLAAQDGYVRSDYDMVGFVGGIRGPAGGGAPANPDTREFFFSGMDATLTWGIVHDIGHAMRLGHAGDYNCHDQDGFDVPISTTCPTIEGTSDPHDDMGKVAYRHFSVYTRDKLGWLSDAEKLTVTASGTYTLKPVNSSGGVKAIIIPRIKTSGGQVGESFYLQFRQPFGAIENYSPTDPEVNGVSIRVNNSRPDQQYYWFASYLQTVPSGQTFADPATGISVTVNSVSPEGASVSVNTSGGHVDTEPPSVPENFKAEVLSDKRVKISFGVSSEKALRRPTTYQLYRNGQFVGVLLTADLARDFALNGSLGPEPLGGGGAHTKLVSYIDSNLSPNTAYSYYVKAGDDYGNVSTTPTLNISTRAADQGAPSAPVLSFQNVTPYCVTLNWTEADDPNLYYYQTIAGKLSADSLRTLKYCNNRATSFAVTAFDANGNGTASNTVNITYPADTSVPSTPTGLTGTAISDRQIRLNWNYAQDNDPNHLYFHNRSGSYSNAGGFNFFSDKGPAQQGLQPDTQYTYRLRAQDTANNRSPETSAINVRTKKTSSGPFDITPPKIVWPVISLYERVRGTVNVRPRFEEGPISKVEYHLHNQLLHSTTTAPFEFPWDTTRLINQRAQLEVLVYDAAGNVKTDSVFILLDNDRLTDGTPPSAAGNFRATAVSQSQINLSWDPATDNPGGSGLAGYDLYRNNSKIASTTSTSYGDTGLQPGTTYQYRLVVRDNAGNSSEAATASATTHSSPDTEPPSQPTNLQGRAVSSSQIDLTWTASTDNVKVARYDIYRNGTDVGDATGTAYSDRNLSSNTTYSYYVVAIDTSGNPSAASPTINVKTPCKVVLLGICLVK